MRAELVAIQVALYRQYYTGKLALRYGHAPSDACQLCGLPDSCTHVAGECPAHTDHIISKHNAACQLTHPTIRKAFKEGGALYSPHTLQLVSTDAGTKSQTTWPLLESLGSASSAPPEVTGDQEDWLDPPHEPQQPSRHPRHVDVSKDVKDLLRQQEAATNDGECTSAPNYIPDWVLPADELQKLIDEGKGAAPDLIYARGISDFPRPTSAPSQRKECALLIIEIGFCRDHGCAERREEKIAKYEPLLTALRRHWGAVEFACIPIGHAGIRAYPPYMIYPLPWPELDHNLPPNGGVRDASSRTWTPRP